MPRFYDPNQSPDPQEWLHLEEQARISQAEKYHKKSGIRLPNAKAHATFHVIVENQIAQNEAAIVRAMDRLKNQGINRHDSIHAIAWVLSQHLYELMTKDNEDTKEVVNVRYFAAVERLNAQDWQKLGEE